MDIDSERVERIIRSTAEAVILPRFRTLKADDVREKAPGDPVTIADTEGEEMLGSLLADAFPDTVVMGEELVSRDESAIALLHGTRPVWVLDPIDGTINFAAGRSAFGMIVALIVDGVTIAGWIHEPVRNITVSAVCGGGAWSKGRRLTIQPAPSLATMTGAAYGHGWRCTEPDPPLVEAGIFREVRNQMCGAVEYVDIALGFRHFMISSRSLPWDHAAGVLIVQEAGGVASFLDRSPYSCNRQDGRVLAAASDEASDAIIGLLSL
ncbi:inositol phosphatase [Skermanella aerolata]|uniref:Inositol phosphatase n=2 Tax=Skermanella aerolata TaxID=393310 RepID=A0A512E2P5_9PROT|nr:inositol phosphatase [Skermanella aerolata]